MDLGSAIGLIVVFAVVIIGAEMIFGKTRRRRPGNGSGGDDGSGGSDGHDADGGSDGGDGGGGGGD